MSCARAFVYPSMLFGARGTGHGALWRVMDCAEAMREASTAP